MVIDMPESQEKVPVYFTPKTLSVLIGILAILWGAIAGIFALMFYARDDGMKLRQDFDHHAETVHQVHADQASEIKTLEQTDKTLVETLHRIELRQEQLAPKHRVERLPRHLRAAPMEDEHD